MELVTNALKYGAGTVTISLRRSGDEIVLTVEYEEKGLPADFDASQSKGPGMRVMIGLLRGQGNRLKVERSRGHTCFVATLRGPVIS